MSSTSMFLSFCKKIIFIAALLLLFEFWIGNVSKRSLDFNFENITKENDSSYKDWPFSISQNYDDQLKYEWTEAIGNWNASIPSDRGEYGKAFVPTKNEEELMKHLKKQYNYNVLASERISVRRSLPDYRFSECQKIEYPKKLPTTSIIIVIHNEILQTLLRTIWSVVDRSPLELLQEIILVDDASTLNVYHSLENHIPKLPVTVKIIRNENREGLIRARVKGAKVAKGSVLTFFDAHMECTEGWLQPILSRIASDRSVVAVPLIDFISSNDMSYHPSQLFINGLRWHLIFDWMSVPERELLRTNHDKTAPLRTPTHVGCAISVDREFFFEIGSFDEGMEIWGSENVELAFRTWLCGGSIEILPCSRVGHLYRISTYSFNGNAHQIKMRNNKRLIEVWMDEFKNYIYAAYPSYKNISTGNLTDRINLRNRLKCKNFRWYLENIYPESVWLKEYTFMGQIKSVSMNRCLDAPRLKLMEKLIHYGCHGQGANQFFALSKNGQITTVEGICVGISDDKSIILKKCLENDDFQLWSYDHEKQLLYLDSFGLCMRINEGNVTVDASCNSTDISFKWELNSSL